VIEVLQKGYVIGERLLRPALAVVSIAGEASSGDDSAEAQSEGKGEDEAQD
jgi:hypothetical protein